MILDQPIQMEIKGKKIERCTYCIPNLELDLFAVYIDCLNLEVDSNGGHEVVSEDVLSKSHQQRGFTDTRVTNEQHFEKVVAKKKYS